MSGPHPAFHRTLYFRVLFGLVIVNPLRPGAGINADPATLDATAIASYTTAADDSRGAAADLEGRPEARAITNLIGNGVATIVVAKWEGAFDAETAARVLAGDYDEALLPLADVADGSAAALNTTSGE